MYQNIFIALTLLLALSSCSDNDSDYREQYVGVYECTKSTRSFEDETFRTDIDDIVITLPMDTDSTLIFDGIQLHIQEDGSTGRVNIGGTSYDLFFEGSSFKLSSTLLVPGFAATCYIIGEKK